MADGSAATGLHLREIAGWSLIQIAAWPSTEAAVEAALSAATGVAVPSASGALVGTRDAALLRVAPGLIWLLSESGPVPDLSIDTSLGCVTPLTHGRRRFRIEGSRVREALAKVVALDLDPARFGVGRVGFTGMHHVPVVLARVDADAYDVLVPRTFATDLLHWIADAGLEFGASIASDGAHQDLAGPARPARDLEAVA